MLKSKYLCTFDLFRSIPTHNDRTTVTEDISDVEQDHEDLFPLHQTPIPAPHFWTLHK